MWSDHGRKYTDCPFACIKKPIKYAKCTTGNIFPEDILEKRGLFTTFKVKVTKTAKIMRVCNKNEIKVVDNWFKNFRFWIIMKKY